MKYLLDTNIIISLTRKTSYSIKTKLEEVGIRDCCITDITLYELYWGARLSRNPEIELLRVDIIAKEIKILQLKDFVKEASYQKCLLQKKGILVEDFDILIGSAAIANNLTLVTSNTKQMEKLENIKLEDWS